MSWTLRASLLVLCLSVCAEAQTRTLALYAKPAPALDAQSSLVMRAELQRLFAPAGLEVVWKHMAERKAGEDFELVAVSSFDGSCAVGEPAMAPVTAASLADTSLSDGLVIPFFHVDCTRVVRLLGGQIEPALLGRALARVIAHEIYHIVARTADHRERGVAKAAFTNRDLTSPGFEFDEWSLARMRPPEVAKTSDTSPAETGR